MNMLIPLRKSLLYITGWPVRDGKNHNFFTIGSKVETFNQSLTKFSLFVNTPGHFTMFCKKRLKISILFQAQILTSSIR